MDYGPLARIAIRYGVGLIIGAAQAEVLAADKDVVTVAALAIGLVVETLYALAKKRGWKL
ncbi:hypothetical protein CKO11_14900 [Rhodobacter sp. TJ_12]|uniref:hypothetical protein n=1 Tax=Rhodobacter sp. TJ_12 TaxID=2029399 RepID=UPI001CBF0A5A|nr:hypothetical protein [Rhodobacter sp. TJ_12]MBZ4023740.1 hypothetical protein [Rhodobacter sp. TJ_12]